MQWTAYSLLWLALILLFPNISTVAAQGINAEGRLRDLFKTYEARAERRDPIWIQYIVVKRESPSFYALLGKRNVKDDLIWRMECELAKKGEHFHSSAKGEDPLRPGRNFSTFTIHNERISLTKTDESNTYQLTSTRKVQYHGPSPFSVTGEDVLYELLRMWVDGKLSLESVKWESAANGTVELLIKCKGAGWKYKYLLDPGQEYSILSSTSYTGTDEYVTRIDVQGYESFSGIPVPIRAKAIHYVSGNKHGFTTEYSLKACKTTAGEIPDRLFTYDLPDDAVVFDMDKKTAVRNTNLTQQDWDDIVRLVGRRKTRWWVWALGAAALAAIATVVAMKRRRAVT